MSERQQVIWESPIRERYRLGRHVHHDERSKKFRAQQATQLRSVNHRLYLGAPLNQGALGSCTGNATVHALASKPVYKTGTLRQLNQDLARKIYSRATETDPWPGNWPDDDTGSSGLDACKAAQQFGWISSYEWAFGLDECLAALVLSPVMVGMEWTSDMDSPDPTTGLVRVGGSVRGGHEFLLTGLDLRKKWVRCLNSWGHWGLNGKGIFFMTFEDLGEKLKNWGDAVVPKRA